MNNNKNTAVKKLVGVALLAMFVSACAPEVGSEKWCKQMSDKPKGDWTATEAKDYAKHCVFK